MSYSQTPMSCQPLPAQGDVYIPKSAPTPAKHTCTHAHTVGQEFNVAPGSEKSNGGFGFCNLHRGRASKTATLKFSSCGRFVSCRGHHSAVLITEHEPKLLSCKALPKKTCFCSHHVKSRVPRSGASVSVERSSPFRTSVLLQRNYFCF